MKVSLQYNLTMLLIGYNIDLLKREETIQYVCRWCNTVTELWKDNATLIRTHKNTKPVTYPIIMIWFYSTHPHAVSSLSLSANYKLYFQPVWLLPVSSVDQLSQDLDSSKISSNNLGCSGLHSRPTATRSWFLTVWTLHVFLCYFWLFTTIQKNTHMRRIGKSK